MNAQPLYTPADIQKAFPHLAGITIRVWARLWGLRQINRLYLFTKDDVKRLLQEHARVGRKHAGKSSLALYILEFGAPGLTSTLAKDGIYLVDGKPSNK